MMDDTITISRAEYEDLVDSLRHAEAMREVATGAMETVSDAEADAYLAAPSALAFWRGLRSMTVADLAAACGIAEPLLESAEAGSAELSAKTYARLAKLLNVRIEDLLPLE